MRRLAALVALVTACGGSEEGTLLVVEAPEGATAERVEIILASADPATIESVEHQRTQPSALSEEPARYYRQRAITGAVDDVGTLNGFAVRLEANSDIPDGELIPILVAFDAQDQITAIGAVMDDLGNPTPIEIARGRVVKFTVAMSTMVQTDGVDGVAPGEVVSIECDAFRSGIAWRPVGTQLRLLLPDRSVDRDATDASDRPRDLDCDGHVADDSDCDDLRAKFHAGAEEACDGQDFDCDFRQRELVPCSVDTICGATTGVAVCDDTPGGTANPATCAAEPECVCEGGQCPQCLIEFEASAVGEVTPCTPALASHVLVTDCEGGCTVEVLKRLDDPFKVTIALPDSNQFADKLTGVVDKIDIRAQAVTPLMAVGNDVVGGIFLAVIRPNGAVQLVSFAIRLHEQAGQCVAAGNNPMSCTP